MSAHETSPFAAHLMTTTALVGAAAHLAPVPARLPRPVSVSLGVEVSHG